MHRLTNKKVGKKQTKKEEHPEEIAFRQYMGIVEGMEEIWK